MDSRIQLAYYTTWLTGERNAATCRHAEFAPNKIIHMGAHLMDVPSKVPYTPSALAKALPSLMMSPRG